MSQSNNKKSSKPNARGRAVKNMIKSSLRNNWIFAVGLDFANHFSDKILKQMYASTGCSRSMKIDEKRKIMKITCKKRWCIMCCMSQMARGMVKYLPALVKLQKEANKPIKGEKGQFKGTGKGFYFVTLTIKNPTKEELVPALDKMREDWRKIYALAMNKKYRRKDFTGLRKLEGHPYEKDLKKYERLIKYYGKKKGASNKKSHPYKKIQWIKERMEIVKAGITEYHPHYHILVLGKDNAQWIIDQWLRLNPTAKRYCQKCTQVKTAVEDINKAKDGKQEEEIEGDVSKALDNTHAEIKQGGMSKALLEMLKYPLKPVEGKQDAISSRLYAHDLIYFFEQLQGRRVLFAFGGLKKYAPELEADQEAEVTELLEELKTDPTKAREGLANTLLVWMRKRKDWVGKDRKGSEVTFTKPGDFDEKNPDHINQRLIKHHNDIIGVNKTAKGKNKEAKIDFDTLLKQARIKHNKREQKEIKNKKNYNNFTNLTTI